jgi:hypothetical protein
MHWYTFNHCFGNGDVVATAQYVKLLFASPTSRTDQVLPESQLTSLVVRTIVDVSVQINRTVLSKIKYEK